MHEAHILEEIDEVISKNWQFKLLWILGLAPLFIAWTMAYTGWGVPEGTKNRGELLKPGLKVESSIKNLHQGKWGLIFLTQSCDQACEERLILMQQVHKALGKEFGRMQSMWIKEEGYELFPPRGEVADGLNADSLSSWFIENELPVFDNSIWLVDPEGNMVLRYSETMSGKDMLKDIKWLFKASQIG